MLISKAGKKRQTHSSTGFKPECRRRAEKRTAFPEAAGRPGFTLIEIVVSLLIISSSILFLLVTIRRGLTLLETAHLEMQFYLKSVTLTADFFTGAGGPPEEEWKTKTSYPMLKFQATELTNGRRTIWVSRPEQTETASP